jgi:hypothetical protein
MTLRRVSIVLLLAVVALAAPRAEAEDLERAPFVTEAYYRIKWGHFDEFMDLFKRNHFPILKELQKRGVIESMEASFPLNHASEESRWDFRMRITLHDTERMAREVVKVSKELYPDQVKLQEEERRRFGLLLAHTDIVIRLEDVSAW